MKKIYLFSCFFILAISLFAQKIRHKPYHMNCKADSSFWFENQHQCVLVFYRKNKMKGWIFNEAWNYPEDDKIIIRKKHQLYTNALKMNILQLKVVDSLLRINQPKMIPSCKDIKGWRFGTDGITYTMEFENRKTSIFKYYWLPEVQDSSLMEAEKIQNFISALESELALDGIYNKFLDKVVAK